MDSDPHNPTDEQRESEEAEQECDPVPVDVEPEDDPAILLGYN